MRDEDGVFLWVANDMPRVTQRVDGTFTLGFMSTRPTRRNTAGQLQYPSVIDAING